MSVPEKPSGQAKERVASKPAASASPRPAKTPKPINGLPDPQSLRAIAIGWHLAAWDLLADYCINECAARGIEGDGHGELYAHNDIPELHEEFKVAHQFSLYMAAITAQQGAEIALKAGLAGVSPFLLFRDAPLQPEAKMLDADDWPTIDANRLIPTYETFVGPVHPKFKTSFTRNRKLRNILAHLDGTRQRIEVGDTLRYVDSGLRTLLDTRLIDEIVRRARSFSSASARGFEATLEALSCVMAIGDTGVINQVFGIDKTRHLSICRKCMARCEENEYYDGIVLYTKQTQTRKCFVCDAISRLPRKQKSPVWP